VSLQEKKSSIAPSGNVSANEPAADGTTGSGNVDKIRDILFGNQIRDYERELSHLEDRVMEEIGYLREESNIRFDRLEGYVHQEFESLNGRLQSERNDRRKMEKDLADEFAGNTRLLSEEIGRKYNEINGAVDRMADALRKQKVDRTELSSLLSELAQRLAEDPVPQLDKDTS